MKGFTEKQARLVRYLVEAHDGQVGSALNYAKVSSSYVNRAEFILRLLESGDLSLAVTSQGRARLAETERRRSGSQEDAVD